jgi:Tfp pilus assembly protein FimT
MLAVMAIMITMVALVVPAMIGINTSSNFTTTAYNIQSIIDQARAYAMGGNTYAWVGIAEENVSFGASQNPQVPGPGRIAVAVVTCNDGTRGYDATKTSLPNPAWTNYNNGNSFTALGKLQHFENVHLADFGATPPATGGMARPAIPDPPSGYPNYRLGNASAAANCVTPFDWPPGSALNAGQYSFKIVINFDPQGVARIQGAGNTNTVPQYMEIDLQPTHGNVVPAVPANQNAGNQAAIQINGMTGATHLYRP